MNTYRRVLLFLVMVGSGYVTAEGVHAQPSVKILLVGKEPDHPHGTHMYVHTSNILAKCCRKLRA